MLLIATVMMGLFTFCSLGQIQAFEHTFNINTLGIETEGLNNADQYAGYTLNTVYIFAVSLLCAILPFIAIFCYKNTKLQKVLCRITAMLIVALCLSEYLVVNNCDIYEHGILGWSSIVATPFIALVALLVAVRMIRNDERKLASYDRIR